jgi:integrase
MRAWNKGKSVGQMKPLKSDEVRAIKQILKAGKKHRDLALLSTGIDTMLGASDLLKLTVSDVMNLNGEMKIYVQIQQKNTKLGLSIFSQTKLKLWITKSKKSLNDFIFTSLRRGEYNKISVRQYQRLVKKWVLSVNMNPDDYSTHSIRRTKTYSLG